MSIKKTLVITTDVNPTNVNFVHDVSTVSSLCLDTFKLVGVDPLNPPTLLYLVIDNDPNVRSEQVIPSDPRPPSANFGRLNPRTVPIYFKAGSSTGIVHGKQSKATRWQMENLKDMNRFRATLVGVNGLPFTFPPGMVMELVFSVKYGTHAPTLRRNLESWT